MKERTLTLTKNQEDLIECLGQTVIVTIMVYLLVASFSCLVSGDRSWASHLINPTNTTLITTAVVGGVQFLGMAGGILLSRATDKHGDLALVRLRAAGDLIFLLAIIALIIYFAV